MSHVHVANCTYGVIYRPDHQCYIGINLQVKFLEIYCFCCLQLGRWNGVTSDISDFLFRCWAAVVIWRLKTCFVDMLVNGLRQYHKLELEYWNKFKNEITDAAEIIESAFELLQREQWLCRKHGYVLELCEGMTAFLERLELCEGKTAFLERLELCEGKTAFLERLELCKGEIAFLERFLRFENVVSPCASMQLFNQWLRGCWPWKKAYNENWTAKTRALKEPYNKTEQLKWGVERTL